MALGYRSVLWGAPRDGSPLTQTVEQCFRDWLGGKGYDSDLLTDGQTRLSADVQAMRVTHLAPDGTRSIRLRLVENNPTGRWVTSLTAADPAESRPWFWIDVENPSDEVAPGELGRWTAAPRLSRDVLALVEASDGVAPVGDGPILLEDEGAQGLAEMIVSPRRRVPILLSAAPSGIRPVRWATAIAPLVRETRGLAATFVVSENVRQRLALRLGRFGVSEGTIRTYLPGLRMEIPVDARRHRWLSSARILEALDNPATVARALGWGVRTTSLSSTLPLLVRTADRVLSELEPSARLLALETARRDVSLLETAPIPVVPGAEKLRELVGGSPDQELNEDGIAKAVQLVRLGLDVEEAQRQMTSQVALFQDRLERLSEELDQARAVRDDVQLDLSQSIEDGIRDQEEVRRLRVELQRLGAGEAAWTPADTEDFEGPADFGQLFDWLDSKLPHVIFTGDRNVTEELKTYDALDQWPSIVWNQLLALEDYAASKAEGEFVGGLYDYLKRPPAGRHTFPASRFASGESETVENNSQYRELRIFPVPREVDEAKCVFMGAHTKIATFAMISPRMHLFDHVTGTGSVYVGYIGRHLRNPSTN